MIMKTSLIVSSLCHVILFLALQKAFPVHWVWEELRTYQVELIRPPVIDMETKEMIEAHISRLKEEQQPVRPVEQDTISLDTKDKRYISYARIIKEKIMYQWMYPAKAKELLMEGNLMVIFSLNRDGTMIQISVHKPSGYDILDKEAIRAISTAAPFPPFPEHVTASRLNIRANFDYRITARR